MRFPAPAALPLALAAGLCLGLSGVPARAGSSPTAAGTSTTSSLGEAFAPSSAAQLALAEHLRSQGVIFYGAFWCQHCFHQKVLFGQQAGNRLPYVECAKDEAGARTCKAAGVMAYPTWVMGSQRRVGVLSLKELAAWTQYQGPAEFGTGKPGR